MGPLNSGAAIPFLVSCYWPSVFPERVTHVFFFGHARSRTTDAVALMFHNLVKLVI